MHTRLRVAGVFLFAAFSLFAQSDRGTITGTVADPAGAVVANAKVEAKNVGTGAVTEVATSATGNYTVPQLPAGSYQVTVQVPGFKKFVRENIAVQTAATTRVDIPLEVGTAAESVTVTEASSLLKTESGELSDNFNSNALTKLPVLTLGGAGLGNIRNPLQVVTLLPGAQFVNDNTLRINGMPANTQTIHIDGQDATNGIWRQQNQYTQASTEAVQEVAVQTSNFAAEYGQAGGGYFNFTMRSGTNAYHGSAYDYLVNEALNAGTPFTDAGLSNSVRNGQHIRNRQRRNDYGFTLGGPIDIPGVYNGHDKTFFFFNFEQFRETVINGTSFATVPIAPYTQGDFSGALGTKLPLQDPLGRDVFQNQVYDPSSQFIAPDGSIVRNPFTGNKVPVTSMDPVSAKVQALLPTPTTGTKTNNYLVPSYSNFRHTTIPSFKIDHSLSSKIKMSFYYGYTHTVSPNANGYTQAFTPVEPQDTESKTIRVNYDQTVSPTLLLHLGVGLLTTNLPAQPQTFDQSAFWAPNQQFPLNAFPNIGITNDIFQGGGTPGMGAGFGAAFIKDLKPTANTSLTWVRGNHTFKAGADMVIDGSPVENLSRANGIVGFSAQTTGIPWELGKNLNGLTTGFAYASFFLGDVGSTQVAPIAETRLGNHAFGMFVQDTWKVTRKLTVDYGIRYDYVTELKEQYGRMPNTAFNTPNPLLGGRNGAVIYEGTGPGRCNCQYQSNYPYAIGPRIGVAYQINSKTVLRMGGGVLYGTAPNNAFLAYSINDIYFLSPSYGQVLSQLKDGNILAPGNRFGNPTLAFPDLNHGYLTKTADGAVAPQTAFISIDRNAGRPPRILQWSIGLQREITRDLVVEANYVGNRGVWWTAPLLQTINYDALTPDDLKNKFGLDINNATDRGLLSQTLVSPAVIARFPNLAANGQNLSPGVYPGFPSNNQLTQALKPYPQFTGIPPFLGPPLGDTWYDSLQTKVTKRLSHGLAATATFAWQKELTLGANSDTSYLTPQAPLINDVFNRQQNKQISGFSRPLVTTISIDYTTPGLHGGSGFAMKALSHAVRDWTIGTVLRYQSGQLIRVPASNNQLLTQLGRGGSNNPALWGGGATFWNRVNGVSPFLQDPNCHCIDPTQQLVLNPAAWTDAPAGQFGTSAPYYNDYRWQRQPSENLNVGRNFRLAKEGKVNLNVRAEVTNMFNRLFLSLPSATNPAAPTTCNNAGPGPKSSFCTSATSGNALLNAGYGYVNWFNGAGASPRSGQIVARLQF